MKIAAPSAASAILAFDRLEAASARFCNHFISNSSPPWLDGAEHRVRSRPVPTIFLHSAGARYCPLGKYRIQSPTNWAQLLETSAKTLTSVTGCDCQDAN